MATRQFAQRRKVAGQPCNVVIVPGHRQALRTQLGACRQQRCTIANLHLRRQRDELDVGNAYTLTRHHSLQLT
ncbi:hypothetical protein D3C80_1798100 [compost metagenome]